jgi:hypothetical protein
MLLGGFALMCAPRTGGAEEIAPGVTYTQYSVAGPNRVHVVTMELARPEYKLKVGWPQKKRNFTGRMATSAIAAQYNSLPSTQVLAAINGSYFGVVPELVGWPVASDGEIVQRPSGQWDTLYIGPSRQVGYDYEIASTQSAAGTLTFANGKSIPLEQYNQPVSVHKVTAITPQYDTSTRSSYSAVEVILENVSYPMRSDKEVSGIVSAIKTGSASINNTVPPGGMVLHAWGIPESAVLANTQVGDRLCTRFTTSCQGLNNADTAVTGLGSVIHNGQNNTARWLVRPDGGSPYSRQPMTVLASNTTHVFLVVCDGRSCGGSVGMSFEEMAAFLRTTLGALDAINLDGGGSSTMVVNGTVRNLPSDNCGLPERAVANAIMIVEETLAPSFPFADPFAATGRLGLWDDKFYYADTVAFAPDSPGGDGHVLKVGNARNPVNTVRRGNFADTDYSVQADIYCEYRPGDAADGYERFALFARDSGTGALGLSDYGGGNCYALTYDTHDGRVRAGKYTNGLLSDFLESTPLYLPASGWHQFKIACAGATLRYYVDEALVIQLNDGSFPRGYFGLGHEELFATDSLVHGTQADNFSAVQLNAPPQKANNPVPADLAHAVSTETLLSWIAGAEATWHDVYFGTVSPGELQVTQTETTFDPGPLELGRTYFWRIDEGNENGTTIGDVWSFTVHRYRGDFDDDRDVDQEDFGRFQACLSGTGTAQLSPTCDRAKLEPMADPDMDVDAEDLNVFLGCMTGPGTSPSTACLY